MSTTRSVALIVSTLAAAVTVGCGDSLEAVQTESPGLAVPTPITLCAGCPLQIEPSESRMFGNAPTCP
jgi:hypothetical protein